MTTTLLPAGTRLLAVVPPSDLTHPVFAQAAFERPFEPVSDWDYEALEESLGAGWYLLLMRGPAQGLDWAAQSAPGPVWFAGAYLKAAVLTRAAEIRPVPVASRLSLTSAAPVAFRLAGPDETALRVPDVQFPRRVAQLPPLSAALRDAGIERGLRPGFNRLRTVALVEAALRGGAWAEQLGMAELTVAERAAQVAVHWPHELAEFARPQVALDAIAQQREAVTDPLLRPLWQQLLTRLEDAAQFDLGEQRQAAPV